MVSAPWGSEDYCSTASGLLLLIRSVASSGEDPTSGRPRPHQRWLPRPTALKPHIREVLLTFWNNAILLCALSLLLFPGISKVTIHLQTSQKASVKLYLRGGCLTHLTFVWFYQFVNLFTFTLGWDNTHMQPKELIKQCSKLVSFSKGINLPCKPFIKQFIKGHQPSRITISHRSIDTMIRQKILDGKKDDFVLRSRWECKSISVLSE